MMNTFKKYECIIYTVLFFIVFSITPIYFDGIGLSWDALNHHIYLGWASENDRFKTDFLAAGYQSYQFPYLYWPIYKMADSGWSGAAAGVGMSALHALAVPPIWLIAKRLIPGDQVFDQCMRFISVALAFCSAVVISLLDSTSNDLLAAIPVVWAVAVAIKDNSFEEKKILITRRSVFISGVFVGASVAFKLSNGPIAILVPIFWWSMSRKYQEKIHLIFLGCVASVGSFLLLYSYWGYKLWVNFGNPIYPFMDYLFQK